jgi:hypothetical protein
MLAVGSMVGAAPGDSKIVKNTALKPLKLLAV